MATINSLKCLNALPTPETWYWYPQKTCLPHNRRCYMTTTQLISGHNPLDVQRQPGHSPLTMTDYYTSLTIQRLKSRMSNT